MANSTSGKSLHDVKFGCRRNRVGQSDAICDQLPVDKDSHVPAEAILFVEDVAAQLLVVGQCLAESRTDGLSRRGNRLTAGEFLQVASKVDSGHDG